MQQRQSLTFNDIAIQNLSKHGVYGLHCYLAQVMLLSTAAETPFVFLNKNKIKEQAQIGFSFGIKLNNDPIDLIPTRLKIDTDLKEITFDVEQNLISYLSNLTFLSTPVMCIIYFQDTGNSIAIVGFKSKFYVIDIVHNLFYQTSGIEYDIAAYQKQYGSDQYIIKYYVENKTKEPIPIQEPIPIKEPIQEPVPIQEPIKEHIKVEEKVLETIVGATPVEKKRKISNKKT